MRPDVPARRCEAPSVSRIELIVPFTRLRSLRPSSSIGWSISPSPNRSSGIHNSIILIIIFLS